MSEKKLKELLRKEKAYDQGMNEGGEGYNPYRDQIKAEMDRRSAAEPWTRKKQKEYLEHQIHITDTINMHPRVQAQYEAQVAELEKINAEIHAEWAAEWTLAETKKRRAEWNARIRAGEITGANGQIDGEKYQKLINDIGFDDRALGEAVKYYNL